MTLTTEDWSLIQQVFHELLEAPGPERERLLEKALGDRPRLREEVVAMLGAHNAASLPIEERLLGGEAGPGQADLVGQSIGPYLLEQRIGQGGMSQVFLARRDDPQFPQQVALKLLLPGFHSPEMLARFRLERQILARLDHPSIARLLDGGLTQDDKPYLVLQYVDGVPITEYCRATELPLRGRLRLFCRVAEGVEYAHRNLVVHRDLKPSNILVTNDGQVRLLDFGIAKLLEPDPTDSTSLATRPEFRILTPEYAAPEQIRGDSITTATDVYSLGVLLHELLTGIRPFGGPGSTREKLEREVLETDPSPPSRSLLSSEKGDPRSRWSKQIKGDLDAIVLKALAKDPELRYPSAGEMARDVERHLASEPILARRPTLGYRLIKQMRRNPGVTALTSISLLLLLGFSLLTSLQSRQLARERDASRAAQEQAETVVQVLVDLLSASNPRVLPGGAEMTVRELLDRVQQSIFQNRRLGPAVQARVKHALGRVYLERSQFPEAERFLEESLNTLRSLQGVEDPAAAAVLHDRARLIQITRPPGEALPILRECLQLHRRLFGAEDLRTASCLMDLAASMPATEEAQALLEEALTIHRAAHLKTGANPAPALNALANFHQEAGQLQEAGQYYRQALQALEEGVPPNHPDLITVRNNLSTVLSQLGDFQGAADLQKQLLAARIEILGEESLPVAVGYGNLGTYQAQLGDKEGAELSFRLGLEILERLVGSDHLQVMNAKRNLGRILELQGHFEEALRLLDDAFDTGRRLDAPERSLVYIEGQRAVLLLRLNRKRQAVAQLRRIASRLEELNPGGHSTIADSQVWLASALLESAEWAEAEQLFRAALDFRRELLGEHHPKVAEAACGLARALAGQHRDQEARTLFDSCLPGCRNWGLADPVELRRVEAAHEAIVRQAIERASPTSSR